MTSGNFDEALLVKLEEVEGTVLTLSTLNLGLWENVVVRSVQLSRQPPEQDRGPACYVQLLLIALQEGQHG